MATKTEVKGITAKRKARPVRIGPDDDPENQFISKKAFIKKRKAWKEGNKAADEARQAVLERHRSLSVDDLDDDEDESTVKEQKQAQKLAVLRAKLASAEKSLKKKPDSTSIQNKINKLSKELDDVENE